MLYVPILYTDTISIVDGVTNNGVKTIKVDKGPNLVAVNTKTNMVSVTIPYSQVS